MPHRYAASPPAASSDSAPGPVRAGNDQIRELLRAYGLRTSLIRLKVIDALHSAECEGRNIGVRGVHAQLAQSDTPLSFLSVREVLKRLCSEGVVALGVDKCYRLQPDARAVLAPLAQH